jgi:ABC-type transport system involved in cytochrome bd biosynthesis fused ATPase/permease subunit
VYRFTDLRVRLASHEVLTTCSAAINCLHVSGWFSALAAAAAASASALTLAAAAAALTLT